MALHVKTFDASLHVRNPINLCAAKTENVRLMLRNTYEGRNFKGCHIVRIREIIKCSKCRISNTNTSAEGDIDVCFSADVAVVAKWDIIPGVKIARSEQVVVGGTEVVRDAVDLSAANIVASLIPTKEAKSLRVGHIVAVRAVQAEHAPTQRAITVAGILLTCDRAAQTYRLKGALTREAATGLLPTVAAIERELADRAALGVARLPDILFFEMLLYSYASPAKVVRDVLKNTEIPTAGLTTWVGPPMYAVSSKPAAPAAVNLLDLIRTAADGEASVRVDGVWCRPLEMYRSSPLVAHWNPLGSVSHGDRKEAKGNAQPPSRPDGWAAPVEEDTTVAFQSFLSGMLNFLYAVRVYVATFDNPAIIKDHLVVWTAMRAAQLILPPMALLPAALPSDRSGPKVPVGGTENVPAAAAEEPPPEQDESKSQFNAARLSDGPPTRPPEDLVRSLALSAQTQFLPYSLGDRLKATAPITVTKALLEKLVKNQKGVANLTMGFTIRAGQVALDQHLKAAMEHSVQQTSTHAHLRMAERDERALIALEMLRKMVMYIQACEDGRVVPDTYLFLNVSDHDMWLRPGSAYIDEIRAIPVFCFAKPRNVAGPLFPETTFGRFGFTQKYPGKGLTWGESMEVVQAHVRRFEASGQAREPVAYFRGALTGGHNNNVRNLLFTLQQRARSPLLILEETQKFTPVYEWCRYKYLLNLPGHYPWSNRLKYLMLLDSVVINVDVATTHFNDGAQTEIIFRDEPYSTFLELVVGTDWHVNYVYDHTYVQAEDHSQSAAAVLKEKGGPLFDFLVDTVKRFETDRAFYDEWYQKGQAAKKTLMTLTDEAIYEYLYACVCENAKIMRLPPSAHAPEPGPLGPRA